MRSEKKKNPVLRSEKCFKISKHETYREAVSKGIQLLKRNVCSFWKDVFPSKTCSWPSLVRVVVSETKTKGASARGAEAGPPHGAIAVSVSSKMWVCSQWVFKLKLHQLGTKILVRVWCISAWDTRHVLLHLGSTGVLQVWGCCWKCRFGEGLEAKQKLSCEHEREGAHCKSLKCLFAAKQIGFPWHYDGLTM